MIDKDDGSEMAAKLRWKAEEIARSKGWPPTKDPVPLSLEESQRTIHELHVHQIELKMQNEELRRVQAELDAARAHYFDLYELAPVAYCIISGEGLILEANLTAVTLLGTARSTLIKQPITRFILGEDQDIYYMHRKELFKSNAPQACELRMVHKDGQPFWVSLSATSGTLAPGAATTVTVSINEAANNLSAGDYSDSVTFTNLTNGMGTTARGVSLTIVPVGILGVSPTSGPDSAGPRGGPFSPVNQVYALTNSGDGGLAWTASVNSNWISLSAASGTLGPAAVTNITVSINSTATDLVRGLEHEDLAAGARQVARAREPVVPGADDEDAAGVRFAALHHAENHHGDHHHHRQGERPADQSQPQPEQEQAVSLGRELVPRF